MPKKRGHPDLQEVLERPWCYYCERDFDDLRILLSHQKAKHFKCDRCNRRLNTAGGLQVHLSQVHKETLTSVDNALPNRADIGIEIFGMEGIPEDIVQQHKQRVIAEFHQAQADRQAATGNPASGGAGAAGANAPKKPKLEDKMSLKERLAAHKAKKAADVNSGENTPISAGPNTQSPSLQDQAATPAYPAYPQQANTVTTSFPQPFAGGHMNGFGGASPQQTSPFPSTVPPYGAPPQLPGYPGQAFSPQYPPATAGQQFPAHMPPFGAGSPQPAAAAAAFQPPRQVSPPQGAAHARSPSLPAGPPGLPQRPSFAMPPVNQYQMQQMHQGHFANDQRAPHEHKMNGQNGSASGSPNPSQMTATNADIDDLIANAAKDSKSGGVGGEAEAAADKKPAKKDKDKDKKIHLVYSDNEVSPEEKMALLPRYRKYFGLAQTREDTALDGSLGATAGATGTVTGESDVAVTS